MFPSSTPSSQTSSGIVGFPFMVGQRHKNGVAFVPNTSSWSSSTPITCGTPYQSGFGSPVAAPFVSMSGNKKRDSFASNHLATSTFTSSGTSSRPSYRPTTYDGPVSTSGGYRATSNVEKLVSISAMLAYNTISHEELRLEDYMTGKRGLGTNSSAVKSTSSGFPRCSSSPAKESNEISFPKITTLPFVNICYCGDPSDLRRTSLTSPASSVSPVSFKPSCYFPFANPSTSPPNQSSFSSFSNPTFPLFTRDPKNAPVSSEPSPIVNKPTTLVSPCVPSTQKCDEEVTGIIGRSSTSQLSSSHTTSTSSLANPFGTLPPSPQLSFERSRSTPIQYGISSIPVKDKPAPVKYPLLTTRHIFRGCKLPVRKYDPKSSVPFFLSEL